MASMEQDTAEWMEEEETYVVLNEPGSVFLQDPLKLEEPSLHVEQDVELKLDMDGSEQRVQVYPSSMNIKEEMDDGVNQKFLEDPLCFEDPCLHIKQDPELNVDVDGSDQNFLEDPLRIEDPCLHLKQDPELNLDVNGSDQNVVASRSYASNSTRLLQSSGTCDFTFEETVRQGMSHSELEISSEESAHIAIFHEGEEEEKEEEEILSAPRLKCSLRENPCQIFSCSFCLQSFSSKYRLMIHVFVHIDGVQPPKFVCKSCGEVFPSYVSLQKHLKFSETDQDSSADKEETFNCSGEHGNILQDDRAYSGMDQTGRQCSSNETVKSFTDKCNTQIATNNAEIRDRNDNVTAKVDIHTIPHLEKTSHKCDICGKSFTTSSSLKKHALIHTGRKPHKCYFCGKSFTKSSDLKNHALIHTGIKPHRCDICRKSFTRSSGLKKHALIHTGIIPHKCNICDKSFIKSSDLKSHALIHTGIKPHRCDICRKSFTTLSGLKKHALIHTGIKPHKCHICDKSFTMLSDLKKHALIHTGIKHHKCDICGKSFIKSSDLKSHALIRAMH